MKHLKEIIIAVAVVVITYLVYDKITAKPEIIEVPVKIEVPVPGKDGIITKDTVFIPKPITNPLNKELLDKYNAAQDSIAKLNMFKDAITNREYEETFEDSVVKIKVKSKVQGFLKDQDLTYTVKPSTVTVDTTIPVKIKKKSNILLGLEVGAPSENLQFNETNLKLNLGFQNTKGNILSLGLDNQKNIYVGYTIKLFGF